MGIINLISAIAGFLALLTKGVETLSQWIDARRAQKAKDKIDEASKAVDESKKNPDDLKGQADALCKLEQATNPESHCDQ